MGSVWLDGRTVGYANVVDVLRAAGVPVAEYDGWQTRSRSSGGFEQLLGIVCHHTASDTTPANDLAYMVHNCPDAPVANCLLDRDGLVTWHTGGAANHAGKGGPRSSSGGTIPLDSGNSRCVGIEAANAGTGQPWTQAQQDSYVLMVRALVDAYGLTAGDAFSHQEWTPPRKCDPTGPSRWAPVGNGLGCNGADLWSMDSFRAEVLMGLPQPPPPQHEPVMTHPRHHVRKG